MDTADDNIDTQNLRRHRCKQHRDILNICEHLRSRLYKMGALRISISEERPLLPRYLEHLRSNFEALRRICVCPAL